MDQTTNPPVANDPTGFVLSRELAEVQLLLDNLSASPDKSLAEAEKAAKEQGLDDDWVEQVCRIRWPPQGSAADQAHQAKLLIQAKDLLVQQTRPATGATIAFTLLVTQEYDVDWLSWFGHVLKPLFPGLSKSRPMWEGEDAVTRFSLARDAYPGLVGKALRFRIWMRAMSVGLFGMLALTCALSWYVAFGNATLTQLASVTANQAAAEKRVSDIENGDKTQDASAAASGSAAPASKAGPSSGPKYVTGLCEGAALIPPLKAPVQPAPPIAQYANAAEMHACVGKAKADADVERVRLSLTRWLGPLYALSRLKARDETPDAYASSAATILGTAVLPVLYGILGAGAAIIRMLSAKMKASQLGPRDLNLSLQQLALGAVVGACIGLFVPAASSGAQDGPSLLAPVKLSGSALSFVAGFGVEQVFAALEGFIGRIFSLTPSEKTTPVPKA